MKNTIISKPNNLRSSQTRKTFRHGFTLIELLVTIALIAILAAILFPVFAQARQKARQTSCLSNMKQLGLGFMQYIQDFDEIVPPHPSLTNVNGVLIYYRWYAEAYPNTPPNFSRGSIYPYTKSTAILSCSSDDLNERPSAPRIPGGAVGSTSVSYGYNYSYLSPAINNQEVEPVSLAAMQAPSDTILLAEAAEFNANRTSLQKTDGVIPPSQNELPRIIGRHNGLANVAFCDGHVKPKKVVFPNYAINGVSPQEMERRHIGSIVKDDRYTGKISKDNYYYALVKPEN